MTTDYAKFLINTKSVERTLSLIQWETATGKSEVFGMLFVSLCDNPDGTHSFKATEFRQQWRDYCSFKGLDGIQYLENVSDESVAEMCVRLWAYNEPEYITESINEHLGLTEDD